MRRQRPTKQDYAQTAAHTCLRTHTFALHIAKECADGSAHALAHAYFLLCTKQKYAQTKTHKANVCADRGVHALAHTYFFLGTKQKYAQTEAHKAKVCADRGARALAHTYVCFAPSKSMRRRRRTHTTQKRAAC